MSIDSINECQTIDEITERRQISYNQQIADGDNYEGVLVGIYEKPTHFVYELLQNADDALATKACFELKNDSLIFSHNGSKDFTIKDIISITGVGNSTKKDTQSVGKFGVGFKSVFSITNTPYIYNRTYNFYIEHLIIPHKIDPIDLGEYTTFFRLPFNADRYESNDIVNRIRDELNALDCATIMFLRNLSSLKIVHNNSTIEIELVRENMDYYELIHDLGSGAQFYLFKDFDTKVSIAYAIKNDKIVALNNLYLYSFLPTRIRSELPFYVDAPFDLATTRESIEFNSEMNQSILRDVSLLFERTLEVLKNERLIDQVFLSEVLPIQKDYGERSIIYNYLRNDVKRILTEQKLLCTINGDYCTAQDGVLYSSHRMVELSKSMVNWFDINTENKIRTFLKNELDVKEMLGEDFVRQIANGIIQSKNNDWLYKFYSFCVEYFGQWRSDCIKQLPIIKTRTGEFKCAYIGNEEQVFKPSNGLSDAQIVNPLFLSKSIDGDLQQKLSSFLQYLDIKERSPKQTIKMTILAKWGASSKDEKLRLFKQIWSIYNDSNTDNKKEIVELLKNEPIFLCSDGKNENWKIGNSVLRGTKEQKLILGGLYFLADGVWADKSEDDKGNEEFCRDLGIIEYLPIEEKEYSYYVDSLMVPPSEMGKYHISQDVYPRWWLSRYYAVDNIELYLDGIDSEEKTMALIELLKLTPEEYLKDEVSGTMAGGAYKAYVTQKVPAHFLRRIERKAWIYTEDGFKKPYEMSVSEFVKAYNLTGSEAFIPLIGLRPDFIDSLPEKEKRGAKLFSDCSESEMVHLEEELRKMRGQQVSDGEFDEVASEAASEEDILKDYPALGHIVLDEYKDIKPMSDAEIFGADSSGIVIHQQNEALENAPLMANDSSSNDSGSIKDNTNTVGTNTARMSNVNTALSHSVEFKESSHSKAYKKVLGDLGEKMIFEYLKEKYGEEKVDWFGGDNKGYDFALTEDGEDKFYIEAKTTTKQNGRVPMTASEWNMARLKGGRYILYILNARSGKIRIINNPFEKYIKREINIEVSAVVV